MFNLQGSRPESSSVPYLKSVIVKVASTVAILVGSLALLGCSFGVEVLETAFSVSGVRMKENVALCFILSGVSLWVLFNSYNQHKNSSKFKFFSPLSPPSPPPPFFSPLIGKFCAFLVISIAFLTLVDYLLDWGFGISKLPLFEKWLNGFLMFNPKRMGLNCALSFILISLALIFIGEHKHKKNCWYAQGLTIGAALVSFLGLIGYVYKVKSFSSILPHTSSMALHTSVTFLLLCVGILWTHPDEGVMKIFTSDTYSGWFSRRLLLAAIGVPFILGWIIVLGIQKGLYDGVFAIGLFAIAVIVLFVIIIWRSAEKIERLCKQRDSVKTELLLNEEKLRAFVDTNFMGIACFDISGAISQANEEFLRLIGYRREDLLAGKINWLEITPSEYKYIEEKAINEAKLKGICTPYEKEFICKNGNRIPILIGYTLVGEEREQAICFILDLSQRKITEEALRESEEKFRFALDNIPGVFSIYDGQRRFQFLNATGLKLLQKSKEEIIGYKDEEVIPPTTYKSYLETLVAAQQTCTPQTTEAAIDVPNYGRLIGQFKCVPLLKESGEIHQILGFAEDITVRKKAEETLQNQQKWLEYVLNLMPTPLLFIEPETAQVIFANKAADELAGGSFPKGKLTENHHQIYYCTDAFGNRIKDEQMPSFRAARGETLNGLEMDWHTPSGVRSLLIFADTLPPMHGHPANCVLIFQDITKLKNVEKALSLGYKRINLLFESANSLLSKQQPLELLNTLFNKLSEQISLDYYFNFLAVENNELIKLASWSGISEEEARKIEYLKFGEGISGTIAAERRSVAVENVQESKNPKAKILRSLGATAYFGAPLIAQGQLLGTLSFASRSQLKFTENEKGMMQAICDQLAVAMHNSCLLESLQKQTFELQEASRLKDEFLGILSHELRTPLNSILGWAQLLRGRKLDESITIKAMDSIERNAKAQTQLIDDLLDLSRMIRGQLKLNVTKCDLVPIIDTSLETLSLAVQAKDIDLRFYINQPVLENDGKQENTEFLVAGDIKRLQQMTWNLLSNAIKFTPPGGRVEVLLTSVSEYSSTTHASQQAAIIQVKDTGVGIISNFIPYVFDSFRQADSSNTRAHEGLGLGLSIVQHLVELHGGNVKVESLGHGEGATFTVKLPLLRESKQYTTVDSVNSRSLQN
jgi:PAS domain S-box-containing protein